jgi:hypothetical protein
MRSCYARALTELAELRLRSPQLAMAASGGSLPDRIRRVIVLRHSVAHRPASWVLILVPQIELATVWAATHRGGFAPENEGTRGWFCRSQACRHRPSAAGK